MIIPGAHSGDLFLVDGKYMLCLGEHVAFQSLYEKQKHKNTAKTSQTILIESSLLSPTTITMIHDFVNQRFTTYKNTIPLRIPEDIDTLLKRKPVYKSKSKPKVTKSKAGISTPINEHKHKFDVMKYNIYTGTPLAEFNQALHSFLQSLIDAENQRCIIFPSLWMMSQTIDITYFKQKSGYLVMTSKTTPKQKEEVFRALKLGTAHTLITTYSQIFQDWYNLKYILLIDQHTRYYKHQQEPRYHTIDVCNTMAKIYGADIDMTGMSLVDKLDKSRNP